MQAEQLLPPEQLRRYADAIVKASLGIKKGDTLVVLGELAHRELMLAVSEAGFRAGAVTVDLDYNDPFHYRNRLLHGSPEARGHVSPWRERQFRELLKPTSAMPPSARSQPSLLSLLLKTNISPSTIFTAPTARPPRRSPLSSRSTQIVTIPIAP